MTAPSPLPTRVFNGLFQRVAVCMLVLAGVYAAFLTPAQADCFRCPDAPYCQGQQGAPAAEGGCSAVCVLSCAAVIDTNTAMPSPFAGETDLSLSFEPAPHHGFSGEPDLPPPRRLSIV